MNPEALSELISHIAHDLVAAGEAGSLTEDLIPPVEKFAVMRPKDRSHGDWASNAAMQLAKKAGMKPRDLAEKILAALPEVADISKAEIAGPGFINFFLNADQRFSVLDQIQAQQQNFGRSQINAQKRIQVEFVSANQLQAYT